VDFGLARRRHLRLGRRGERMVCRLLRNLGAEVLLRNYRCPAGEIDLIARDGLTLCFIEVKTRRSGGTSRPAAGLHPRQQQRIRRAAQTYLREIGHPAVAWRCDLYEVIFGRWDLCELRHWPEHFSGDWRPRAQARDYPVRHRLTPTRSDRA